LKLPENFHVRMFRSSRIINNVEKYLMPLLHFGSLSINPTSSIARADRVEVITHVSKMRLLESLLQPALHDCFASKLIVGFEEWPDLESEVLSGGSKALRKKKAADEKATTAPKTRRRIVPKTVTKCWQEV
jgi:hypothetical protein